MIFSSILFLFVFLPIFLLIYHLANKNLKNYILLISSLLFYAWGAPKFIFLLLFSLTVNFYIVRKLYNSKHKRKLLLTLSIVINIGLLVYFKYTNFLIENLNNVLVGFSIKTLNWLNIALPIGISFFTFQSVTYTIDVYRNIHKPLDKLTDYLLYILMFPQLIAGPIVRFNTIADDLINREQNDTIDNKLYGVYRFIIGLSKKVLIANVLAEQVEKFYSVSIMDMGSGIAWIAIIAYSFQIYFDFSGYSDMAIGLGRIIGFKFPENFNNPYVSQSISEFWRRWHITLGEWMKDYLYIPLGGNKVKSNGRLYFNLIFVFLISGFWHGASWNFIIWGAWHGLFLILDRIFLIKSLKNIGKIPKILLTYFVVLIGWVFFRMETIGDAFLYLHKMFSFEFTSFMVFDKDFIFVMILAILFSFVTISKYGIKAERFLYEKKYSMQEHIILFIIVIILFLICSAFITSFGFNPFIYFRF
jgi:alginate O-acetyltransferase complex protein AlgI